MVSEKECQLQTAEGFWHPGVQKEEKNLLPLTNLSINYNHRILLFFKTNRKNAVRFFIFRILSLSKNFNCYLHFLKVSGQ